MSHPPHPELSRLVRVGAIGSEGLTVDIAATPGECALLATRLVVPSVESFKGQIRLSVEPGGTLAGEGEVDVRLTRECVVSLEPFPTRHREKFRVRFVPAGREGESEDPEAEDEIPFDAGQIDVGEVLVEQVALGLDPYPRSPGAKLPGAEEPGATSPFSALAALRAPPKPPK